MERLELRPCQVEKCASALGGTLRRHPSRAAAKMYSVARQTPGGAPADYLDLISGRRQ